MYHENLADLALIRAKKVAIIGYGSQGIVNFANKRFGLGTPVSPRGIEVSRRVFGKNLILTLPRINHLLDTITNSCDHIAKHFYCRTSRHFAACRNDSELVIRPAAECFEEAVEGTTLCGVDFRIAIPWKYLAGELERFSDILSLACLLQPPTPQSGGGVLVPSRHNFRWAQTFGMTFAPCSENSTTTTYATIGFCEMFSTASCTLPPLVICSTRRKGLLGAAETPVATSTNEAIKKPIGEASSGQRRFAVRRWRVW